MKSSGVTIRRRIMLSLILITVGFAALMGRLGFVQLYKGNELSKEAEDSWRREIPFSAKRGEILDRNGVRLAYNISSPSILAIPVQIKDKEATAAALASVLGTTKETMLKYVSKKGSFIVNIQPAGRKITLEKAQQVRDLNLKGIVVAEDNKRYYPFSELAGQVLGIVGLDGGLTGVEKVYDDKLQGQRGNVSFLSDAAGRQMPNSSEKYTEPQDGLNLQLTLDKHLQTIVEREQDQAMAQLSPRSITTIVMNPKNGEILAMSSKPGYDPGNYREYAPELYNRNLPIWSTYEPGSTFKIITLAAAVQEKKVNLKYDHFYDPGYVDVSGAKLRCWKKGGHGSETFMQVVENSCNPGFVALGQRLGKDKLFEYIKNFGFGQKTGIDLNGEATGILFKLSRVGPVELATTAFGQGVSVTPIQQVAAVSAAINGGYLYQPHVGKRLIQPETGTVLQDIEPGPVRQVISEESSKIVREALESVVAKGTGGKAFIDGYRVGGKTGTAQKVINGRYSPNEHIVSFIGFAPADDPQLVVYTAVDNPQGIQFGGLIAAPIVRNIMEDALQYMGVPKRKDQIAHQYKPDEVPLVTVPDMKGMTLEDIYQDMNTNFNLAKSGTGKVVIAQAPKPGERVEKGSTIRIYMGSEAALPNE